MKILKKIGKILGIIIVVLLLSLIIIFVVNKVCLSLEKDKIADYGEFVSVDGKNMNVLIEGEGKDTIVILPGHGTASPVLDYQLLIKELSSDYRVVVVEPFGYGLSDRTDKDRTNSNISKELHECLDKLGIDKYILMGHSIYGIYGLDYINRYPEEVQAFVGIDTSVPVQIDQMEETKDISFALVDFLSKSGLIRVFTKANPESAVGFEVDRDMAEEIRLLTLRNQMNKTVKNEIKFMNQNFTDAQGLTYPKDLPVIYFITSDENTEIKNWKKEHEKLIENQEHGKVIVLDGSHYLHHTQSKAIGDGIREFLK